LLWYARAFADGKKVRIDTIEAEALDVVPGGERAAVRTSAGLTLDADRVVLATGNPPPADLPGLGLDHPRYVRNPWGAWEAKLPDPGEDVALLGTGLTAVDVFLTLRALGWRGKVYALSRTGLLPMSHFKAPDYTGFPESDPSHLRLDEAAAMLESHCGRLRDRGLNPAILVDKLRPYTQRIWQQFTPAEKRRFLSEYRTRWNVARHRVPEAVHREVADARAAGRLEVIAGKLAAVEPRGTGLRVVVETAGGVRELPVGGVVNCTGPAEGPDASSPGLYGNLLRRGLVSADEVGLGVRATADFAAVDRDGARSKYLMVLGPPLKGVLWETTAVPELRAQAFRTAEVIVAELHARRAEVRPVEQTYADVVEYSI
jgi:uncharacterized NAD(P)/FAD-binding protein YdhS